MMDKLSQLAVMGVCEMTWRLEVSRLKWLILIDLLTEKL
jgi:hypothetical protein